MEVIAHRGFAGVAPENTLVAFQQALEIGVDMVELDVQLSQDGHPVVIHDETVNRTTNGTGWVNEMSLAELRGLQIADHRAIESVTIPTLHEVIACVKAFPSVRMNIELKTDLIDYPGIEALVNAIVRQTSMQDRVIFSSFNHHTLRRLKQISPDSKIACLFDANSMSEQPWQYAQQIGAEAIHVHLLSVTTQLVDACHGHGMGLRVYTVNQTSDMQRLIELGIDGIFTDYPDRLLALLT